MNRKDIPFIEKLFSFLKVNSIKKKLFLYSVVMITLLSSVSIYSIIYTSNVAKNYNDLFGSFYDFHKTSEEFTEIDDTLVAVLSLTLDRGEIDTQKIKNDLTVLIDDSKKLEDQYKSLKSWVGVKGLIGLLESYGEIAVNVIEIYETKDGVLSQEYFDNAKELRTLKGYIDRRFSEIMGEDINQSTIIYDNIKIQITTSRLVMMFIFVAILFLNFLLLFYFANRISSPIASLSRRTERIANGDLDVTDIAVITDDDLGVLAISFNKMSNNIKNLVTQITEKADIEVRLKEEEMKNLKVMTELKETELKVLQSQINPHFLFNTLNTTARLAMFEEADETLKVIESTSELLRYNLGKIKKENITLKDEIDNVKEYIFIQKTRFSDRITFEFDIDESLLWVAVPYLILQPMVENAIIHGIEPLEKNGKLELCVFDKGEYVAVRIADNGVGIEPDILKFVYVDDSKSKSIGVSNVRKRIEYFYDRNDLFLVDSQVGKGTTVEILIPKNLEVE
jgi:two-component system, sensor histidine kinase YesM